MKFSKAPHMISVPEFVCLLIASGERFCCHAPKASDLFEAFREFGPCASLSSLGKAKLTLFFFAKNLGGSPWRGGADHAAQVLLGALEGDERRSSALHSAARRGQDGVGASSLLQNFSEEACIWSRSKKRNWSPSFVPLPLSWLYACTCLSGIHE